MKFVIQRVKSASVKVEEKTVGEIGKGYLVLIGVGREDTEAEADRYLKKLLGCGFLKMSRERPICPWRMWAEACFWSRSLHSMPAAGKATGPALSRRVIRNRRRTSTTISCGRPGSRWPWWKPASLARVWRYLW